MITENKDYPKEEKLKKKLFFGNTLSILKNPVEFLGNLVKSYGPAVSTNFTGKKYFVLQHPKYIKHVLLDNHKGYSKTGATKILRLFLGEGLVTTNGELWLKKRRLIQPAFHKQRLSRILDIINEETDTFISKLNALPSGTRLDFSREMLHLNGLIVSRALFGTAVKEEMDTMMNVLEELTNYASKWIKSIIKIPINWPTPANIKFNKNCKIFDNIIYKIIDTRRKYKADPALPSHDDLLDMLLDYVDEDTKNEMSEKQLRDEVTTIFMGGHETTAQTLSWIFYQLAKEKQISKKVADEAENVLKENLPRLEHMPQLVYTKQVIQEGLRRYPSIIALVRIPNQADIIYGIKIPNSSNVLISIYGMHHHPDYWENPEIFNPENFNALSEQNRAPYVFLPFGGGPRLCIGNSFAMLVMQVVVSRLIKNFEFDLPEGYIPQIETNITLRAKNGIQLVIKKQL